MTDRTPWQDSGLLQLTVQFQPHLLLEWAADQTVSLHGEQVALFRSLSMVYHNHSYTKMVCTSIAGYMVAFAHNILS